MSDNTPKLLVVDDEPIVQRTLFDLDEAKNLIEVRHPRDVTETDLTNADLVLVDYRIEDWRERDQAPLALRPPHGVALAGILRAHAERAPTPTAFALRSAHLTDLSGGFPPENRKHSIARRLNLEWVFTKSDTLEHMCMLAGAVKALPEAWPENEPEATQEIVKNFLSLGETSWAMEAWQDILNCHPPLHELSERSHGLAFLRWFLHRILPYPCFLCDTHYLAVRLRIDHSEIVSTLKGALGKSFDSFKYKGSLVGFLGDRWWRSGLEAFLWQLTEGDASDPDLVLKRLSETTGLALHRSPNKHPVVCLDANLQALSEHQPISAAVRIQPDDWPPYADQAWTTIELAREHDFLRAKVLEADKERVESSEAELR